MTSNVHSSRGPFGKYWLAKKVLWIKEEVVCPVGKFIQMTQTFSEEYFDRKYIRVGT